MKSIITCTGYGGTGSSVVSDLLKEFKTVHSFGDFEFRFLQDPKYYINQSHYFQNLHEDFQ